MAWDRGYYYRSMWNGGEPRRVYVGAGLFAELAAEVDAHAQEERAAKDAQRRLLRARERAQDKAIDEEYRTLKTQAAAALLASGFYEHKREWRRMGKVDPAAVQRQVTELMGRANGPAPAAEDLAAIKMIVQEMGEDSPLYAIAPHALRRRIVERAADGEATQAILHGELQQAAAALGRETAGPLERSLIDHVLTCWLRLQVAECEFTNVTSQAHEQASGAYWDRRLTEAQRRYLRALGLLAKLRHLQPAVLQVNMAQQQVVMNG